MYYNLTKKLLLVLLSFTTVVSFAQMSISGKVTDAKTNEPLIGATVLLEGSSNTGTITDFNGDYSISVPNASASLKFSYAGYTAKSVVVGNQKTIDMALSSDLLLDEVVVVGYGSVKKKDATGAVVAVTEKDFNKGIITSADQLLQGRAAGVQISSNSGEPGGGSNIRIRGSSSFRNGSGPLIVVDGVPLGDDNALGGGSDAGFGGSAAKNPLNLINPNDIARIDVLKDASATAIYGSRGANGVIQVTTKKGESGKSILDYNYSLGISSITKKYDLFNRDEFIGALGATYDYGGNTDWQEYAFRNAITQSHNVSFGAADGKGDYRVSFSNINQEGIIRGNDMNRTSLNANASRKFLNDRLTVGTQVTLVNVKDNNVPITDGSGFEGDLLASIIKSNPSIPIDSANGLPYQVSRTQPTPRAFLYYSKDYTNTLRALGNVNATLKITNDLSFKTILGFDRSASARRTAFSKELQATLHIPDKGRVFTNDINIFNKLMENYLTYDKSFGKLDFGALLGYSYQNFNTSSARSEHAFFSLTDPQLMINNTSNAGKSVYNTSDVYDELQSYFGRVNFGYAGKYLLTASLRADGSTKFGPDNKYGYFPSAAFKWKVSEEGFLPKQVSELSLRLGYGVTGNQSIAHNLYDGRSRFSDKDINDVGDIVNGQIVNLTSENYQLKWESTRQVNLGIDFGFLDNRIFGTLEYYSKNTSDLLVPVETGDGTAFSWKNIDADVINQGVELSLNATLLRRKDLRWDIGINGAYNTNIVENYKGQINTGRINGQGLTGAFAQAIANGQPLYA